MSRLSSLRQQKLTSAYRIGPARAYLVYFTQSWRSLPSMFVLGTIEDTPNITRTGCKTKYRFGSFISIGVRQLKFISLSLFECSFLSFFLDSRIQEAPIQRRRVFRNNEWKAMQCTAKTERHIFRSQTHRRIYKCLTRRAGGAGVATSLD